MKNLSSILKNSSLALVTVSLTALVGCIDPNNNSYPSSYPSSYGTGYGNGNGYGNGGGYSDPYYRERRDLEHDRRQEDRERRDIENERMRVEQEQRRLEQERATRYSPPPRRQERQESCPSGYSPSERKCSNEDRKHGCHDMRLPGGLGCVSR